MWAVIAIEKQKWKGNPFGKDQYEMQFCHDVLFTGHFDECNAFADSYFEKNTETINVPSYVTKIVVDRFWQRGHV